MSTLRFSPDLSAWLVHNLDQGAAPVALVDAMVAQNMQRLAAHAIVSAFVRARQGGLPVPVDAVQLDDALGAYHDEAPRLNPATSIATSDRLVRVAARAAQPMLAVLNEVLSDTECEQLIELARPRLTPSTVVDPLTGRNIEAGTRTSFGMFFRLRENDFIARLDRRLAEIMNLPVEHGEGLQILYYPCGGLSAPHFDFLVPSNAANQASLERSGQRVSTLVTYLNTVEAGGATVFPEAGWTVSPQRGNAVYFEYCNSLDQVDHRSLHASSEVLRGDKWVATKWMRQRPFVVAG